MQNLCEGKLTRLCSIKTKNGGKNKMAKVIANTTIKREKGKLYFCGTDANGNVTICETEMARGRKKQN
jgi:hypothetical protein